MKGYILLVIALTSSLVFPVRNNSSGANFKIQNIPLAMEQGVSSFQTGRNVLINDSTTGHYNTSIGTVLDGTQPQFPPANHSGGDPTINPAAEPNLKSIASIVGSWLSPNPIPLNSNWSDLQNIPSSWPVNTETAIIYPVSGGENGIHKIVGSFGVDNGIFVWVNGVYKFGALAPGAVHGFEYIDIDLGSLNPGNNYIQILREDHGDFGGYTVKIEEIVEPPIILDVPSYKQGLYPYGDFEPPWENQEYDDGVLNNLYCGSTIHGCGCAMTSTLMVMAYYGVILGPNKNELTPETLNIDFRQNRQKIEEKDAQGNIKKTYYNSYGFVYGSFSFPIVDNYSARARDENPTQPLLNEVVAEPYNAERLRGYIESGTPVVLQINYPGIGPHWVVVKGYVGNQFIINDPIHPDPELGSPPVTLETYKYTPVLLKDSIPMRIFTKKEPENLRLEQDYDYSSLNIYSMAPAKIVVTDPLGKRTGANSIGESYQEIPNSIYYYEPVVGNPAGEYPEPDPNAGFYQVHINTPLSGSYELEISLDQEDDMAPVFIYGSDKAANSTSLSFSANGGADNTYVSTIKYDPEEGTENLYFDYTLFIPLVQK